MSKLYDFLNPVSTTEEREVVISKRFVQRGPDGEPILDADGNMVPRPFKIRAITQQENDAIIKACKRKIKGEDVLDTVELSHRLVVTATLDPDFRDTELCEHFGTMNPYDVPAKMLLSGEYSKLMQEINDLSGFNDDAESEAKN